MIAVRVSLILVASHKDSDLYLGFFQMPEIPGVGELININGNPFRVIERSWAIAIDEPTSCYLRVLKAGDFKMSFNEE